MIHPLSLLSRPIHTALLVLPLLLFLAACSNEEPLHIGGAPSEEKATAFAKKLEAGMKGASGAALDSAFNLNMFFDRITHGIVITNADRDEFRKEAGTNLNFGRRIMQNLGPDGTFRFIRLRHEDGDLRALFRAVQQSGGMNYYEFLLVSDSTGAVRIADAYTYLGGEFVSATVRRLFIASRSSPFARLFSSSKETQVVPMLNHMLELVQAGKFTDALAYYKTLPPDVQKEKGVILQRVTAAMQGNSPEYLDVLREARRELGEDITIDMVSLDYYYMTHQLDSLASVVDRIDRRTGGDPYLNTFRATIAMDRHDGDKAAEYAWAMLKADPDNPTGYWAVVNASILRRDNATISRLLDSLKGKFDLPITPALIKADTLYREYAASPEFTAWAARQK